MCTMSKFPTCLMVCVMTTHVLLTSVHDCLFLDVTHLIFPGQKVVLFTLWNQQVFSPKKMQLP